jgi:hypothetical protein
MGVGAGALVVWAKQLGRPRVGWLGAINRLLCVRDMYEEVLQH